MKVIHHFPRTVLKVLVFTSQKSKCMTYLAVDFLKFLTFDDHWVSWISMFMSLDKFGKCTLITFIGKFQTPHITLQSFWDFNDYLYIQSHRLLQFVFLSFSVVQSWQNLWIHSKFTVSFLCHMRFLIWAHMVNFVFVRSEVSMWFFSIFSCFANINIFSIFHMFQEFDNCLS